MNNTNTARIVVLIAGAGIKQIAENLMTASEKASIAPVVDGRVVVEAALKDMDFPGHKSSILGWGFNNHRHSF